MVPISSSTDIVCTALLHRLSKRIHAIPTVTSLNSAGITRLFLEHVWRHHGLPEQVLSDWGPAFVSRFTKDLAGLLGVKLTPSTTYHPQTDGQTERVNQEIKTYLRIFINHRQDDWASWLPLAKFCYNNCIHSSTCHSPFELDTGRHPRLGIEPGHSSTIPAVADFTDNLHCIREEAKCALTLAADNMAKYYDRGHERSLEYTIGDQVWLNLSNYPSARPSKKLDNKWAGPFKVVKVVSPNAVKLALSGHVRGIHPVMTIASVRHFIPDGIDGRVIPPPPQPIVVDGRNEMEIERILDCKMRYRWLWYLVKFKGWLDSDNKWIPINELTHAQESIEDFYRDHPNAPQPKEKTSRSLRIRIPGRSRTGIT